MKTQVTKKVNMKVTLSKEEFKVINEAFDIMEKIHCAVDNEGLCDEDKFTFDVEEKCYFPTEKTEEQISQLCLYFEDFFW